MAFLELVLARDARWRTGSTAALERRAATCDLVRIAPGAYVPAGEWEALSPPERLMTAADAMRAVAVGDPVFSHETAAAFHGIPIIGAWPDRPTATVGRAGDGPGAWMRRVRRDLAPGERVLLASGVRVTSMIRTAIDLAATRSLLGGIVAVSDLRHRVGVAAGDLEEALAALGPFHGAGRARAAVRRSTAGSESPLESLVVARCQDLGFEVPEQQAVVRGADGVAYRCDFVWDGGRIVGEADGRLKYEDGAFGADRTAADTVWAEKRREDAIRGVRERFVRISWHDAWRGTPMELLLRTAGVPRPHRARALTF